MAQMNWSPACVTGEVAASAGHGSLKWGKKRSCL